MALAPTRITWSHLGLHDKPGGIVNVEGFFDHLLAFLAHSVETGFIGHHLVDAISVASSPEDLLTAMGAITRSPAR